MNILNKITIQNLKLNKKRTIVTIIGIMLSTALICGVAGLVSSFQQTLMNFTIEQDGNYHTTFKNIAYEDIKYIKNNNNVEEYFITKDLGWANLEGSKNTEKPYVSIYAYDKKALNDYGMELVEGRLPENSNEILIPKHIRTNGRVDLKIGDTVTFNVGTRMLEDGTILSKSDPYFSSASKDEIEVLEEKIVNTQEKTYKVVGIIERPSYRIENFSSPGYTCITYMEKEEGNLNISVLYKEPKQYDEINKEIMNSLNIPEDNVTVNSELLRFEGALDDNTLKVLYGIAAVVIAIIVISSVFVIRNSFSISVSEKNKQYGMLSSVGATSKQIKRSVLFEGFVIGLIAIPLGILAGVVAIAILLQVVNYLLKDILMQMKFVYSLQIIPVIISIIVSFITIYLSCLLPARRAAKISPIESIRGNNDIKMKSRKIKTSRLTKKLFGIGGTIASKNLKRSKKKYRTTVISIVISIVIFISLSTFLSCGKKISSFYYTEMSYNISVSSSDKALYDEILKLENIKDYSYCYVNTAKVDVQKYGTDYGKQHGTSMMTVFVYNNEYFKKYIKELGLKEDSYNTSAILIDEYINYYKDGKEGTKKEVKKVYNLKDGDEITINLDEKDRNIKIAKNTDIRPMGLEQTFYGNGMLIVSEDFMGGVDDNHKLMGLKIYSENCDKLENDINDLLKENLQYTDANVFNYELLAKQENRMVLVISIFLYGFMAVITLIGVTNIFNTITTNMILRSKEFAMLKSIGMTKKEFNKMIRLESILYGVKSLLIGIPIGVLGSYFIYKSFAESMDIGYTLPIGPIIISILFVFIIVGFTMKYSLNKINKQNIIETIRKDNI